MAPELSAVETVLWLPCATCERNTPHTAVAKAGEARVTLTCQVCGTEEQALR